MKELLGYTKRDLAKCFEVSSTTIWNYIYCENKVWEKRVYVHKKKKEKKVCIPCATCEVCLTQDLEEKGGHKFIPLNLQLNSNKNCLGCILRKKGLRLIDLYEA